MTIGETYGGTCRIFATYTLDFTFTALLTETKLIELFLFRNMRTFDILFHESHKYSCQSIIN